MNGPDKVVGPLGEFEHAGPSQPMVKADRPYASIRLRLTPPSKLAQWKQPRAGTLEKSWWRVKPQGSAGRSATGQIKELKETAHGNTKQDMTGPVARGRAPLPPCLRGGGRPSDRTARVRGGRSVPKV